MAAAGRPILTVLYSEKRWVTAYGTSLQRPKVRPQVQRSEAFLPTPPPPPPPPRDSGMSCSRAPCSAGHRQKLEDQTKAFPDRFGELERLRMRVTPSTPSPRSSLSTTSHFGSQAQTPIQGMSPSGDGGWGGQGPGAQGPGLGPYAPERKLIGRSLTAPPWS